MPDRDYTLSELARRSKRSKATLLEMLAEGRLAGTRADAGRREWRITDDAAREAGLELRDDGTIDDAVRSIVADGIDPWAEELVQRLDAIENQLATIESQLLQDRPPQPATWWQQLRCAVLRKWRR